MKKIVSLVAGALLLGGPAAADVVNPHIDTSDGTSCLYCHEAGFEDAGAGAYTLLEPTIDAGCLTCHEKTECCNVGRKHSDPTFIGYSHPSDLRESEMKRASLPRTLPLQDGKMTCNTCHFHRRPAGPDYKLVRLVDFTDKGVEWTRLCQDCHADM